MSKRQRLFKDTDYEAAYRCGGGRAILREEVWIDDKGEIVRYNLAFLLPHLFHADNGRVLGYDNAHGTHERHFMGGIEEAEFKNYETTAERFYSEAEDLARSYEDKNHV